MSTMTLSPPATRRTLPALLILVASASAGAKTRPPYLDDDFLCRAQPLPAVVQHVTGDAWKLDPRGKAMPLQEGMTIDEQEGVKTSASAFVSLSLGDGSRCCWASRSLLRSVRLSSHPSATSPSAGNSGASSIRRLR